MSTAQSSPSPPQSSSVAPSSSPGTSLSSPQSSPSPDPTTDDPSTPSSDSSTPVPTTDVPTTSNTPPTSQTPTTPQTIPTVQSPSGVAASPSASASASLTAAAPTTTTSTFTSQVVTTLSTTDAAGSVVYLTTSVPEVITTSISTTPSTSSSSSHTAVIVGAVVGGVAGITILVLLLFCIRKRVRKDEFDGNFDPDRVVGRADAGGTLPRVDLAEEVTPFPHAYTDQGSSSMRQYGASPYIGIPSSLAESGQTSPELYSSGGGTSSGDAQSRRFIMQHGVPPAGAHVSPGNMYGATGEWHNPRSGVSPPPSTTSYNSSSTRGAKEREALGRHGQGQTLGLATQPETAEGGTDVVVHRDAGRAPVEEHPPLKEIPPAYESIPQD